MARVIAHAVTDRERPLRRTVEVPFGPRVLRITPELSAQVVAAAKRRPGAHNARRRAVEALLWRTPPPQVPPASEVAADPDDSREPLTADELGRALRRQPQVVA